MTKYALHVEGIIPAVSIWPEPAEADLDCDPLVAHGDRLLILNELVHHLVVIEAPSRCRIGGENGSRAVISFRQENHTEGGDMCKVEHYLVRRGPTILGISFGQALGETSIEVQDELESVKNSMLFW